jgi:hypothetical protein
MTYFITWTTYHMLSTAKFISNPVPQRLPKSYEGKPPHTSSSAMELLFNAGLVKVLSAPLPVFLQYKYDRGDLYDDRGLV